jgi:hypothetical protein
MSIPAFDAKDRNWLALVAHGCQTAMHSTSGDEELVTLLDLNEDALKRYVEVSLIYLLAELRKQVREVGAQQQRSEVDPRWQQIQRGVKNLHTILPDPTFVKLVYLYDVFAPNSPHSVNLLSATLGVIHQVQKAILLATNGLQQPMMDLKLEFAEAFPFVAATSAAPAIPVAPAVAPS